MSRIKLGVIICFIATCVSAETVSYLIYRQKCFPNDKYTREVSPQEQKLFKDAGKKTIQEAKGQPSRLTYYNLNATGKYAIFSVDAEFDPDKNQFNKMVEDGCALKLAVEHIETSPCRIGTKTESIVTTLGIVPTDFFTIAITSDISKP